MSSEELEKLIENILKWLAGQNVKKMSSKNRVLYARALSDLFFALEQSRNFISRPPSTQLEFSNENEHITRLWVGAFESVKALDEDFAMKCQNTIGRWSDSAPEPDSAQGFYVLPDSAAPKFARLGEGLTAEMRDVYDEQHGQ